MRSQKLFGPAIVLLAFTASSFGVVPKYEMTDRGLILEGVSADCPMIYDNDWWKDVPDAAYIWAKASMGKADLRGNIVSRDMWRWREGYTYKLEDSMKDVQALLETARASGLRNIPDPIAGASEALVRPESGRIEDTKSTRSPGSDLIVAEAKKATPDKRLLVFAGGPNTTVAAAYLTDPSIADRIVVFQIDGGAYNEGRVGVGNRQAASPLRQLGTRLLLGQGQHLEPRAVQRAAEEPPGRFPPRVRLPRPWQGQPVGRRPVDFLAL